MAFSTIKKWLLAFLQRRGRTITRFPIAQYFRDFQVDLVLDVGANRGQYALEIRQLGFQGRIVSFEPQSKAYELLAQHAKSDRNWETRHYGLGSHNQTLTLHISGNNPSSSILEFEPTAVAQAPFLETIGHEEIDVRRLDDVFSEIRGNCRNVFLKIDTQGFERPVLEGASNSLSDIVGLQLELSLVRQYQGEPLIEEMIAHCRSLGFVPFWMMDGYRLTRTMQLQQVDVVFFRT